MADRYSFSLTTFSPRLEKSVLLPYPYLTYVSGKLVQIGIAKKKAYAQHTDPF